MPFVPDRHRAWGVPAIKPLGTPATKAWLDDAAFLKPGWAGSIASRGRNGGDRHATSAEDFETQIEIVPLSSTDRCLPGRLRFGACWASRSRMARLLAGTVRHGPSHRGILCMLALGFVTKMLGAGPSSA
jgi:lactate permease